MSEVPCANDELKTDTSDKSDELKIDTFDKLDELLRTVEKQDLAAFRRVNFIYNVEYNDPDMDRQELRTARFLGALPRLQRLQLDGFTATGQLLQRAITEASATSFGELKTVIWGSYRSPLDEVLPLWGFPVEHIEVSVAEPVSRSRKSWPAPNPSLKRLNLHLSTIEHRTLEKLLHLSPYLELLRYDHWCQVWSEWSSYVEVFV
jgi:hypothetical protein